MSDIPTSNWSEAAASNNAPPPNGAPEGMAPGAVNDALREMMAAIKREWNRSNPTVVSGGPGNAQTLTYASAPPAYVQGMRFCFIAGAANSGPATLNVNALGARGILADGAPLAGGEIAAGGVAEVVYDGAQFALVSRPPMASLPGGLRNALLNGDLEIWQRGAGGAASIPVAASATAYTADRWYLGTGAGQAHTVSQQPGLTAGSRFSARVQRNPGQAGTGAVAFAQPLATDMLAALRGQTVTISAKLRSGANWSPAAGAISLTLYTGTGPEAKRGAGFAAETSVASAAANLGTGSAVTPLSATSAAPLPANATQGELRFAWTPTGAAGAADYVEIDEVQLEAGGIATAFDRRLFGDEWLRCRRFYQKSFEYSTAPAQGVSGGEIRLPSSIAGAASTALGVPFDVRMRTASPTMTIFNPVSANAQVRNLGRNTDGTSTTIASTGSGWIIVTTTGAAGWTAGDQLAFHYAADGEI